LRRRGMSKGKGSVGNVVAAIASFIIPGLGQLAQGRLIAAIFMFVLTGAVWAISLGTLGWIGHIIAALDAARYKG